MREHERAAEELGRHARGEEDERQVRGIGLLLEVRRRLGLRVDGLHVLGGKALNEGHVHRHLELEHVDAVAWVGELAGRGDDLAGLCVGVLGRLGIQAVEPRGARVVGDELHEERHTLGAALIADALHEGALLVVDSVSLVRVVVEQELDGVGPGFLQPADAPHGEEVRQAAGRGGVVAGALVGNEQAAVLIAELGRRQAVLRIEQDSRGVRGELLRHEFLELHDVLGLGLVEGRDELLHGAALVDGEGRDHAVLVEHAGQALALLGAFG